MTDYTKQEEIYEAKLEQQQRGITIKAPTFEENVSKLLRGLSSEVLLSQMQYQVDEYLQEIEWLKQENAPEDQIKDYEEVKDNILANIAFIKENDVLSYLAKELKTIWSEGDLSKMLNFQEHCKEVMNKYFLTMGENNGNIQRR